MADSPYIKWWTSDFLTGVIDLTAEEIGIYTILLTMMADRGGPLDDEPSWLARRCGTTTFRFNRTREKLEAEGKLTTRNGLIGNRRMLTEIRGRDAKSKQASTAAEARWAKWREEHPASLPFDDQAHVGTPVAPVRAGARSEAKRSTKPARIRSEKTGDNAKVKSEFPDDDPQKSAENADADACFPFARTRARPEPESESHPNPTQSPDTASSDPPQVGPTRDLQLLYEAVCDASGFATASPGAISRAMTTVQSWRDGGIDFDSVVLPTIRKTVADSSEPTRVLSRFDKAIQHEHARQKARLGMGRTASPPQAPLLEPDDEHEQFRELRRRLLAVLRAQFVYIVNPARFDVLEQGGKRILRVTRQGPTRVTDGEAGAVLRDVASSLGFDDVWKG